eukprot:292968-Karenia_brevis.AAC.1
MSNWQRSLVKLWQSAKQDGATEAEFIEGARNAIKAVEDDGNSSLWKSAWANGFKRNARRTPKPADVLAFFNRVVKGSSILFVLLSNVSASTSSLHSSEYSILAASFSYVITQRTKAFLLRVRATPYTKWNFLQKRFLENVDRMFDNLTWEHIGNYKDLVVKHLHNRRTRSSATLWKRIFAYMLRVEYSCTAFAFNGDTEYESVSVVHKNYNSAAYNKHGNGSWKHLSVVIKEADAQENDFQPREDRLRSAFRGVHIPYAADTHPSSQAEMADFKP